MSDSENSLRLLDSYKTYSSSFMDLKIWDPFVRLVCLRHNLSIKGQIRPGLAGTYPTFIVADRWVIKFFGQLFSGATAYQAELQANKLVSRQPDILAPAVIATGDLLNEDKLWRWPYLIFEFIPGMSIGEKYDQIELVDKLALARQLGEITRHLHHLNLEGSQFQARQGWKPYLEFLEDQRSKCVANHRKWNSLPEYLIMQIEDYLLPAEEIIDCGLIPSLIHADITRDHILGEIIDEHWETRALIDFGDSMIGDVFYELAALHLDLFQRDKHLLSAYLDSYDLSTHQKKDFHRKAMSVSLLHQFNVFYGLQQRLKSSDSLETLAIQLWEIGPS